MTSSQDGETTVAEAPGNEPVANSPGSSPLLEVRDLEVRFKQRHGVVYAVNGVSYSLSAGSTVAVVGESGSGKTVSARAVLGLLPRTASVTGSILFDGEELVGLKNAELRKHRGADIAMIFQDSGRSLNPVMRVGWQLVEGIRTHQKVSKAAAKDQAIGLLQQVRIPEAARRFEAYPHQLSGGMRQRVMTAIALASNPRILIADEATTALDVTTQAQIMELLLEIQQTHRMGLLLISHDMGLAASYTDEVIVMYGGRVVEHAPTSRLFAGPRMPYTRNLLDAVPRLDHPSHAPLATVKGQPPSLFQYPDACSFNPRCDYATEECRTSVPPLTTNEDGEQWACFHPLSAEGRPQ